MHFAVFCVAVATKKTALFLLTLNVLMAGFLITNNSVSGPFSE